MAAERDRLNGKPNESLQPSANTLQRQLEETRESITKTVTEIQNAMTTEYQNVKSAVGDTFDWKLQVRNHPLAFSLGALAIGVFAGSRIMNRFAERDLDTDFSQAPSGTAGFDNNNYTTRPSRTQAMLDTVRHSSVAGQISSGASRVVGELVDELVKLGREALIPSILGAVTGKLGLDSQKLNETHSDRQKF